MTNINNNLINLPEEVKKGGKEGRWRELFDACFVVKAWIYVLQMCLKSESRKYLKSDKKPTKVETRS